MSEETLNTNLQKKIIFFIQKKLKTLIILLTLIIITLFSFLVYKNLENKNNIKLSEKYSQAVILLNQNKMEESKLLLQYIITLHITLHYYITLLHYYMILVFHYNSIA